MTSKFGCRPSLLLALVVVAATIAGCTPGTAITSGADDCGDQCDALSSSRASLLRNNLRDNLRALAARDAAIFGQQRFNITGVDASGSQWLASELLIDESDARTVTGRHPGVLGIDVWDLAIKPASWSPSPAVHAQAARHVFASGGVVTMEWHMRGCNADVDSFYAAGNEDCLCRLANDDEFASSWLIDGKLARFADALEAHGLTDVPIIFRPLHEMTGSWFWWGYPYWNCADRVAGATVTGPAAYQRLFRRMIDYLRDERGLDNLLVAYSPDKLDRGVGDSEEERYLAGYPGDDYVDVLGIDLYYLADHDFAAQTDRYRRYLALVSRLAVDRGKIAALTETGNYRLASETTAEQSQWFTEHLLPLLSGDPAIRLAFALTWENRRAAANNFYVPYAGHVGADDFRAFADSPGVLMLDELGELYAAPGDGASDEDSPPTCSSCAADSDGDGVGVEDGRACIAPPSCFEPTPYPFCAACDSDPDGDGWGWENQASCVISDSCAETTSPPVCLSCDSDPDGDGWGWENEASCVIAEACVSGYPTCAACDSDPDGDGWGWENEASCIVSPSCP